VPIAPSSFYDGRVRVNYRNTSAAGGSVRVAVMETGSKNETLVDGITTVRAQRGREAKDCTPLRGDDLNGSIAWSSGDRVVPVANGASVVLKFVLDGDVELFSFSLT
jgi:hypothetical protein